MPTDFQIVGITPQPFEHLFALNAAQLARHGARRLRVDANPGYPCRISLIDAPIGEEVIALTYAHHDVHSPYRAKGPIFIRPYVEATALPFNAMPPILQSRLLSVRAYDRKAMMRAAQVVQGGALAICIEALFQDPAAAYLHVHNAAPGCFNCAVERA